MSRVVSKNLRVPLGVRAPEPELAAFAYVVVAGKHSTSLASVVITCHEVALLVVDEHGVAHVVVLPPACIDAVFVEVHVVECLMGDRPVCKPVLAVESHILCLLREDDLVVLVHESGHVGPVEHGVVVMGRVDETSADLHV